ncbi:hypothetical protein Pmani_005227 [Petrolisthes manimaculis]|uniref:Uncharacterized protein n=1 Tax=Petrolisthes manimaculis TaxID=1843537 RepID=A0AAE1UHP7_9EUCA|nr:hypothetical protein Pmani_005227 [Petrolisthes manimaculis]
MASGEGVGVLPWYRKKRRAPGPAGGLGRAQEPGGEWHRGRHNQVVLTTAATSSAPRLCPQRWGLVEVLRVKEEVVDRLLPRDTALAIMPPGPGRQGSRYLPSE